MEKNLREILERYHRVNVKLFTPTRLLILHMLNFHRDGLQFRELVESIKISDGKMYSDLEILKGLDLVESEKIEIDNKKIEIYSITTNGGEELEKIRSWLKKLYELGENK